MRPRDYEKHFVSSIVKSSGICRATVEHLLPFVFDEIRRQLAEGGGCVPIQSFGTFAVKELPERQRRYTYKGADEIRTLPPARRLKFLPTRNVRREIEEGRFDPTRKSFTKHPEDPSIRTRRAVKYHPNETGVNLKPIPKRA